MHFNIFLIIYVLTIFKVNCCFRTYEQFEDESQQYRLSKKLEICQRICFEQNNEANTIACRLKPTCAKCWTGCKFYSENKVPAAFPWPLRIATMVKQEFLVATHVAWEPNDILKNCLVTWEVYGGGLMGNLMTDTNNVELSLWPNTKYRVHVTCNSKKTGHEETSPPIFIDTSNAIEMKPVDAINEIDSSISASKSQNPKSPSNPAKSTSDKLFKLFKELKFPFIDDFNPDIIETNIIQNDEENKSNDEKQSNQQNSQNENIEENVPNEENDQNHSDHNANQQNPSTKKIKFNRQTLQQQILIQRQQQRQQQQIQEQQRELEKQQQRLILQYQYQRKERTSVYETIVGILAFASIIILASLGCIVIYSRKRCIINNLKEEALLELESEKSNPIF